MKSNILKSKQFTIPGGTHGYLLDLNENQSVALVEMDGRYPESGYSINSECTETLILLEGRLKVYLNDEEVLLSEYGDTVAIVPGTKYWITGKGKSMDMITPGWKSEQNKIIKE